MHKHLALAHFVSRLLTAVAILGLIVYAIFWGHSDTGKETDPPAAQASSPQDTDEKVAKNPVALVNRSMRLASWGFGG